MKECVEHVPRWTLANKCVNCPKIVHFSNYPNALTANPSLLYGSALASHLHMPSGMPINCDEILQNVHEPAVKRSPGPMHLLPVACEWVYGGSRIVIKVKVLHTSSGHFARTRPIDWRILGQRPYTHIRNKICCANARTHDDTLCRLRQFF